MKRKKLYCCLLTLFASILFTANTDAQEVAIKSNIAYDATASVNLGMEFALTQQWTFEVSGNLNAWNMPNDMKWKHWFAQPEFRYWFCEKYSGHFLGIHAHSGQFNVGGIPNNLNFLGTDFSRLSDSRFQGWFVGGGIAYGYAFILGKHFNLELELGIGYVGPTKAAVNLVYLF